MLLAGIDNDSKLAMARFGSSYAGTQPLEILSGTVLGVGKDSSGNLVLLRLSGGELVG